MKCETYRELYEQYLSQPLVLGGSDESDDDVAVERYRKYKKHGRKCEECAEWALRQELKRRGVKLKHYPCIHLADHSSTPCSQHADPWTCPDRTIIQLSSGEFVIPIRDGGHSGLRITHCPWCGIRIEK